ncbi:molecular chaperone [Providencia rettgeri]|uniref:fimbrial biogenesis chaperone n=1 Tax=Providencia rettgeri TaxID=587 RepID=UPI00235FA6AF|nr:molecular chaperone [Providencia rettgeri]EMB5787517.1 molecular chaperone [Providencia rettgeri]MDK7746049.1 molecular chaperone [Providencia rettgeri]MDK7758495.1 molecular chaperone [Providencia rettgeri]
MKFEMFHTTKIFSFSSLLLLASTFSFADGVSLDATRIVYPQGDKSVSISIKNSHSQVSYLTRTFITSTNNDRNVPFETTPPVFKIAPKSQQEVRILEKSNNLPSDRESLFFFHATMIAGQSEKVDGDGLNIGYDHVIKVFYRPKNLKLTSEEAQKKLSFQSQGNQLKVTNDSPYYINLAQININKQKISMSMEKGNTTIAPYSSLTYPISSNMQKGTITWRAITDLGGMNEFKAQLP